MRTRRFGKFESGLMQNLFGGIYRNKRVFITGHTGFKGSWLAIWLSKLGAEITGYSIDVPTRPSHFELLHLDMNSIVGDVLDKKKLLNTIKNCNPAIVFHLAAQPIVRRSYQSPIETIETNIIGTANVLESCRKVQSVKAIEVITSDKCYQNRGIKRGYRETDPLGGNDPYSASKSCAEHITTAYRKSFFNVDRYGKDHLILLASARAGNVIGGGDWAQDRIIPDVVKAASRGEVAVIRHPGAVRPWQHVLESLSGYLQLGGKLLEGEKKFADCWNFGPANTASLKVTEVLEIGKGTWGRIRYQIKKDKSGWKGADILRLDSSKAKHHLRWKGIWGSQVTIEKTINWYKRYYEGRKVISDSDLDDYVGDAKKASLQWAG